MKCAIITGGSRGIGRAICLKLAEEKNYHILINYTSNEDAAKETLAKVEALGSTGEILKFDVGNAEETLKVLGDWQGEESRIFGRSDRQQRWNHKRWTFYVDEI